MPDPKLIEVAEEWMPADSALPSSSRTVLVTDGYDSYAICYYNHPLKGWALDGDMIGIQGDATIYLDGTVMSWMDIL